MLKLIPKYQKGKNIIPVRATPTFNKKSWETEEDYQERLQRQSLENTEEINKEIAEANTLNKQNRQEYLKSKEGQQQKLNISKEDSKFFKNMKVTPNNSNRAQHDSNFIQDSMQSEIDSSYTLGTQVKDAIESQVQQKLNKWKDYKHGLDATLTAIELGLSGGSILGAYANWKKWSTAGSTTKKAIANFLQKAQLPMQIGGTVIDGYQTYDAIQNNDTFNTAWNTSSGVLGVAGSLGASDITRFHNPKIDLVLDMLGLAGNFGDFIKFGIEQYSNDK